MSGVSSGRSPDSQRSGGAELVVQGHCQSSTFCCSAELPIHQIPQTALASPSCSANFTSRPPCWSITLYFLFLRSSGWNWERFCNLGSSTLDRFPSPVPPGCPPCPCPRSGGCEGLALGELPSLQGQYSVTLSTSRLWRQIINGLSLCFYGQETNNKPTIFSCQENDLNKIAIGYHESPTCSCVFVLRKQHT